MDTLVLYMRDDQVEIRHAPAMKSVLSSPGDPIAVLSRMPAYLQRMDCYWMNFVLLHHVRL